MMNCHEMRCPFESICRHRDAYTDRSEGCATQKFIVDKAIFDTGLPVLGKGLQADLPLGKALEVSTDG